MQAKLASNINAHLGADELLEHLLPVDAKGADVFDQFRDGVLMCRLVCLVFAGSIGNPSAQHECHLSGVSLFVCRLCLPLSISLHGVYHPFQSVMYSPPSVNWRISAPASLEVVLREIWIMDDTCMSSPSTPRYIRAPRRSSRYIWDQYDGRCRVRMPAHMGLGCFS